MANNQDITYMSDLNDVTISGNIGKDPEFRHGENTSICNISVAVNKTVKGEKRPEWVRIVAFGGLAEVIKRNASKGRKVVIKGYLNTRSFVGDMEVTLDDGRRVVGKTTRWVNEVVATSIFWMDSKRPTNSCPNNDYYTDDPGISDEDIPF